MRRIAICYVACVLFLISAAPASAAIRIERINFNPAGADTGSNSHLNRERIYIRNVGGPRRNLHNWKLFDSGRAHVFTFPDLVLARRDVIVVSTGSGKTSYATECNGHCFQITFVYWGLDNYVWDNGGDRATLKNRMGDVVDRCAYTASADSPKLC